jgi:hypothetical protein
VLGVDEARLVFAAIPNQAPYATAPAAAGPAAAVGGVAAAAAAVADSEEVSLRSVSSANAAAVHPAATVTADAAAAAPGRPELPSAMRDADGADGGAKPGVVMQKMGRAAQAGEQLLISRLARMSRAE